MGIAQAVYIQCFINVTKNSLYFKIKYSKNDTHGAGGCLGSRGFRS